MLSFGSAYKNTPWLLHSIHCTAALYSQEQHMSIHTKRCTVCICSALYCTMCTLCVVGINYSAQLWKKINYLWAARRNQWFVAECHRQGRWFVDNKEFGKASEVLTPNSPLKKCTTSSLTSSHTHRILLSHMWYYQVSLHTWVRRRLPAWFTIRGSLLVRPFTAPSGSTRSFFKLGKTWVFLPFFPFESAVFHFQRSTTFYDTLPAVWMWTVRTCLLSAGAARKRRMCASGGWREGCSVLPITRQKLWLSFDSAGDVFTSGSVRRSVFCGWRAC